jgi:rubrerythrin
VGWQPDTQPKGKPPVEKTKGAETMRRLIDANELKKHLHKDPLYPLVEKYGMDGVIDAQPTIDAEPVKRGKWTFIRLTDRDYGHKAKECSSCGSTFFDTKQWNYCPNCGADMRGEAE